MTVLALLQASALQDIISTRCGLSAIIPVAHEKNGASTGLKCDLAEQAQSTPFQTFTMDISVLYLPFLGSIISQVSSTECRALAAST